MSAPFCGIFILSQKLLSFTDNYSNTQGDISTTDSVSKEWNFDDGIGNWENAGWDYQYDGTPVTVESEYKMLKVNVDYSNGIDNSWSQIGVREWGDIDVKGTNATTFDLYYDPSQLTKGFLAIKETLQYQDGSSYKEAVSTDVTIDTSAAVDSDVAELAGWKKVPVTIAYDAIDQIICNTVLCIVGKNTTYSGALYIDNIKMTGTASTEDIYIDSTLSPVAHPISVSGNVLNSYDKDQNSITTTLPEEVALVDGNADANTKALYAYLKAIGESKSVIYGHQNDTWHKAGNANLSNSDTTDLVGSVSGIIGIDTLSITGNEYSAARYNEELKSEGEAPLPETPKGNVEAAARLTNYNIQQGAIITLSAHMPNFSQVAQREDYDENTDPTYAKYDFSGYSPNIIKGDTINNILPGGQYNEEYTAYLDMIADYASMVNGPIMFRPFHENTGSWFWWGKAFCDPATYKNVYKYTVEYLRDVKNIHNILYVYGPGCEAASVEEYGERYPGDNYVDMVGFDMYHQQPTADDSWFESFKAELDIVNTFGNEHNKLIAVTETGVASSADPGDNQTALHKTGNEQPDWYNHMLETVSDTDASYFLLWANFGKKDGFYTPYVESVNEDETLHGHEMMDNFISFYNDPRSLFASEQAEALSGIDSNAITAVAVSKEADGYITAPVSGKRILDEVKLTANTYNAAGKTIKFVCTCGDKKVELDAVAENDSKTYSATLDTQSLASLGEGVGTIKLFADDTELDSIKAIFNMPEPTKDPYEIDGFENYFGEATLLLKDWATNKDSGCTIDLSLTNEEDKHCEGNYSLKFTYNEKVGGWAGATISKEVDWSDCNALKLWTIPDGKNQKIVIQITANGKEYEVYLNDYDKYKNSTKPLYVTIPFSAFKDRDGDGPEGGLNELKGNIQSFGLWVNQIGDAPVEGTIYYDKITAVSTDLENVTFAETDGPNTDDPQDEKKPGQITGVNSSYKLAIGSTPFTLKAKGQGTITYISSNSKVVTVDKNSGKVTVKGIGSAYITVTAAGNDEYEKVVKKISITVIPQTVQKVSVKSSTPEEIAVSWGKQSGITGYQISYSRTKDFKDAKYIRVTSASKTSYNIKNLAAKKTYYVRVRSYKTVSEKNIYGSWSSAKSTVVKQDTRKSNPITGVKSSYKTVIGSKPFTLKAKGQGTITYTSSNSKVVTVDKKSGKVTVKGIGNAYISVTAAGNTKYKKAVKKISITVTPKAIQTISAKSSSSKKIKVSWSKQSGVTGYQISYSRTKDFKQVQYIRIKNAKQTSYSITNLASKKTYYVRVRSYKSADGKNIYGSWSSAKKIVVK